MTCNYINDYKVICTCKCDLNLQLMSILDENEDEKYTYIIHF
jgi:hypothetical protein